MLMLIKIHRSYRDIIAICDSDLLGKKFEEDKMQLEVGNFFEGDEKTEEEIKSIMEDASREDVTFNVVGERAVKLALETGIIGKEGIKKIQGVPVALTLL